MNTLKIISKAGERKSEFIADKTREYLTHRSVIENMNTLKPDLVLPTLYLPLYQTKLQTL